MIYLDYAATTPIDPRVRQTMEPYLSAEFGNPGSIDHRFGWDAAEAVEEARGQVAELIGAASSEMTFTSCATESINLALKGLASGKSDGKNHLVTTVVEHEAVLETCRQLESTGKVWVDYIPVDSAGRIDLDVLRRRLRPRETLLVCLMLANNELGTIYPIREAAALAHAAGALFFCDATQAAGKIPIDVRRDRVDLLAFSAHKLYGPKGVGALYLRAGEPKIKLEPLIVGGGQERGLRSGTLNVAGIVGLGEACRIATLEMATEEPQIRAFRDRLEEHVLTAFPAARINSFVAERLPHITNICFSEVDARMLIREMRDVAVSTRSACASNAVAPSHVLKALGLSDDLAYSSLRISFGRFTTSSEIDQASAILRRSVGKLMSIRSWRDRKREQ
jgi:cysteine desulfurase